MTNTQTVDTDNPAEVISYVQRERFRMLEGNEINPPRAMLLSDFVQTALVEKKLSIEKENNKANQEMVLAMQNVLSEIKHDPYALPKDVVLTVSRKPPSLPDINLVEGETFIGIGLGD